jgi:SAM-dependent methyltransferase
MLDDLARYNQSRWDDLVRADIEYSRPFLDLDAASALGEVDQQGVLCEMHGEVAGQDVLCLASGGGQQSAAFGLLGARVTVFDLSAMQLERDRQAATHYGLDIRRVQGDMRDLSVFGAASFDVVWHAFSISFVPDVRPVFREVARVLRPGGLYRMQWSNPFFVDVDDRDWNGSGYTISRRYADGEPNYKDPNWDVCASDGTHRSVPGPREFCHTLSTVTTSLARHGFVLLGLWEELSRDPNAAPGTWEHFKSVAPPWLTIWATLRPDVFPGAKLLSST